jgi:glycogen synthase
MKVLMLGWEFPPFNSGGLGTACKGLTKGLSNENVDVTFVLPKAKGVAKSDHVNLIVANNVYLDSKNDKISFLEVNSLLVPYITTDEYLERYNEVNSTEIKHGTMNSEDDIYGKNLYEEVHRYSQKMELISKLEDFDLIHAHDWMTYPAGIVAKKATGKPLVCHIHATEFDRTGGNVNQYVYNIEREGFHNADKIIAVSNLTKNKVVEHYGVNPDKIEVVHNAVEFNEYEPESCIKKDDKVVLFLGRITIQKGPEYFLYAAKRVLDMDPNVKFVVAGSGDMEGFMINEAARLGIGNKMLFTGFLRGKDIDRAYKMADLYVMPSVSEPFGITPLESMRNGTPVLISKNSGVSEVLNHCLKVDFWDIDQMSNKILATLKYGALHKELKDNGYKEVHTFNWNSPAKKCVNVYNSVL